MDVTGDHAALISGSPSPKSKSRTLLERARERLGTAGFDARLIDLASLTADALLGRGQDPQVSSAIAAVLDARIVVASSPVYRATYSGLLKVFFDLLPQDALVGKMAIPILTGGGPAHLLALDHGLRPLLASLGATVIASGIYGTDAQFKGTPDLELLNHVDHAVDEAVGLLRASQERSPEPQ